MQDFLKDRGYKVTPARIAILSILNKSKKPLTAEDIHKRLIKDKKNKKIDEATVYRNLALLSSGGILKKINFGKDSVYFEFYGSNHHHHIVCIKCELVEDFENKDIEKAIERVSYNSSKFINIIDHSLEIFGVCKNCL